MSLEQILKVWDCDVGEATQQVLFVLANAADKNGNNVYPSQAWTAWRARVNLRTAKRVFKQLRKDKVLVLVRRGSRRPGERRSNEYRLWLDRLPRKPSFAEWCAANHIPYTPYLETDDLEEAIRAAESGDINDKSGDTAAGSSDLNGRKSGDITPPKTKESETKGLKGERVTAVRGEQATRRATPIPSSFALTEEMREWARLNAPSVRREVVERETTIFVLKYRSSGKYSCDWLAEWQIWILRKATWTEQEATAQQSLPLDAAPPAAAAKLVPTDPNCKWCYGGGMEIVPGKGAKRCRCRTPVEAQTTNTDERETDEQ
jgi:hypothetical protein